MDVILTIHMTLHTKLLESIVCANPLCVHKISKLPQAVYRTIVFQKLMQHYKQVTQYYRVSFMKSKKRTIIIDM